MIVCVDAGNSAVKVAAVGPGGVLRRDRVPTEHIGDPRTLARSLTGVAPDGPRGVAVSSVVPGVADAVREAVAARWTVPVVVVTYDLPLPIRLEVSRPELVGADRICAAAAATADGRRDVVVVDAGSAVTVDRVRGGAFTGGAILPGPAMMLDALGRHARALPVLGLDALEELFPDPPEPTKRALAFGTGAALVGGILEAARRLGAGAGAPVVVTGGHLPLVDPFLPPEWRREPDLVARGLYRIAAPLIPRP